MRNIGLLTLVVIAVLSRFLPHLPNATAVGALAIFSGYALRPKSIAFLFPLLVLFLTDFLIGFHSTMLFTYGAWALVAGLSMITLQKFSWIRLAGTSLVGSTLFFFVTNLGVWLVGDGFVGANIYPKTFLGLTECFVAALPFFGNQIAGDILYSGALFLVWMGLQKRIPALQRTSH